MLNKPSKSSKNFKQRLFFFFTTLTFPVLVVSMAHAFEKQPAVVQEVLTGDTIRLEGGKTLKYIGLSSPPLQSIIPLVRQYGAEALEFNKQLLSGKKILVEWDSQIRDTRNNFLGYVFLEDGTFVNKEILKAGHARAVVTPPNLRYASFFRKSELEARRSKKGIWEKEPENPYLKSEYIGEKNTKLYYLPNSPELERIPQANLVKFDSRVAAKAAGYRACPTCHESNASEY